jgi:hypothetical protein
MFRDCSRLLMDNPRRAYRRAAALDIDGDGIPEAMFETEGSGIVVMKWGGEAFYDVTPPGLRMLLPAAVSRVALPGPMNAAAEATGERLHFLYAGVVLHDAALLGQPLALITGDFDQDREPEVFVLNEEESNQLFAFRDGGWREVHCGAALLNEDVKRAGVAADFDGDGKLELFIATLGPLRLLKAAT